MTYRITQSGFTLLELVLVLFILAIITTTSLSILENEDGQLRFDESFQKLDVIGNALLNERESRGSPFLSGFIIDNGALPSEEDMNALVSNSTGWSDPASTGDEWSTYDSYRPYYLDVDDSEKQIVDEDRYKLEKGFRGPYLRNGLDSNNQFKDSWGTDFDIDIGSDTPPTEYSFTFDANSPITDPPFSVTVATVEKTIAEEDWSVTPESLNITVNNNDTSNSQTLRIAVLVFSNSQNDSADTDDDDLWQTFFFDVVLAADTSTNSTSETWETDNINDPLPNITRVPVGEHLVLLLDDNGSAGVIEDFARLTVFPSGSQPEITLEFNP